MFTTTFINNNRLFPSKITNPLLLNLFRFTIRTHIISSNFHSRFLLLLPFAIRNLESKILKNTKMASRSSLFCSMFFIVFIIALKSPVEASKEFKVGDSEGWRQPNANESAIYNQWAAGNRFRVGDSLRFEYKNDSVLVVDKFGYYHCNTGSPISTFNHGNTTVVNLDKPGSIYFISGDPNHCKDGQRLVIEVMSLHANPPYSAMSPSSNSGSGVSDSVTLVSVSMAVMATSVTLFSAPFAFA